MGKKEPDYTIDIKVEKEDTIDDLKAIVLDWYLQLAMEKIRELSTAEREMLIAKLKEAVENG